LHDAPCKEGHLAELPLGFAPRARANGCPWGEGVCRGAARGAHLAVLHWARANGCEFGSLARETARALVEAEELDAMDALQPLGEDAEHGCQIKAWQTAGRLPAIEAVVEWPWAIADRLARGLKSQWKSQ
jgi:hypothetical protein